MRVFFHFIDFISMQTKTVLGKTIYAYNHNVRPFNSLDFQRLIKMKFQIFYKLNGPGKPMDQKYFILKVYKKNLKYLIDFVIE